MLEMGNDGMSTTEYQAHFNLWAISAALLLLDMDNDLTTISATTTSILTNTDVITVDQERFRVSSVG